MKLASRLPQARHRRASTLLTARAQAAPDDRGAPVRARKDKETAFVVAPAERAAYLPDLLHAQPALCMDEPALQHTLSFAFVAGSAGGALGAALAQRAIAKSTFHAETLQDGLFIDELLTIAFDFPLQGRPAPLDHAHLRRLLTRPPADAQHVAFRQAVLAELIDSPELEQALLRAYQGVIALPALLDEEGADARLDTTQWRLDVLRAVRDAVAGLEPVFAQARSGLQRLHRFGEHVRGSLGYERLQALLDFEGDAARAQLQIRLGVDGQIRSLEIVSLRERSDSLYHVPAWRRALRRLLAWLQGYRIGPTEVVDRWLESVFEGIREHIPTLLQLKGDLEFYLCALRCRSLASDKGLSMCLPELLDEIPPERSKRLLGLWNPLLLVQARPPVTTDVELPGAQRICLTTGPNSGGKTRFLQALSFAQLLGQCGSLVPARTAVLKRASGMFVSLGEAVHADQKEGRLGMELVRVRRLFEQARPSSVVVLDELCSGTNPSEGEEIFRMLLEFLHELKHEVHVTTHFLSFAQSLTREAEALGLCFLQVELDGAQRPTYRFVPGVATTSLAHQTAERLGVTREQLRTLVQRDSSS